MTSDRTIPLTHPTTLSCGFPAIEPKVFRTPGGAPYFKEAGVAIVAKTDFNLDIAAGFFESWDAGLGFMDYMADEPTDDNPADLCKFAGQLCYLSFGPNRTTNADAAKYIGHILESGHGSVLEHATYSLLLYGIDRTVTHELIRHRVGLGFSQVSQRFCDGKTLRFVERPEWQPERLPADAPGELVELVMYAHEEFMEDVDRAVKGRDRRSMKASSMAVSGHPMMQAEGATARRKRVNQAVRDGLPGYTEAPILVTGNARAWRNFVDQRAVPAADAQIRELAVKALRCLRHASPLIFGDYAIATEADGVDAAASKWRKV